MLQAINEIFTRTWEKLAAQAYAYVPPLLAALVILVTTWVLACLLRWLLTRAIRRLPIDRLLRESGIAEQLGGSQRVSGVPVLGGAVYWTVLILGGLAAISAFETTLSTQIVATTMALLPKLALAAAILVAGRWLSQYFSRGVLVWASNEELPHPRRMAAGVRVAIMLVAVAAASETLGFAHQVLLLAFTIILGGAVLAASLAIGLGGRGAVARLLEGDVRPIREKEEWADWKHV